MGKKLSKTQKKCLVHYLHAYAREGENVCSRNAPHYAAYHPKARTREILVERGLVEERPLGPVDPKRHPYGRRATTYMALTDSGVEAAKAAELDLVGEVVRGGEACLCFRCCAERGYEPATVEDLKVGDRIRARVFSEALGEPVTLDGEVFALVPFVKRFVPGSKGFDYVAVTCASDTAEMAGYSWVGRYRA